MDVESASRKPHAVCIPAPFQSHIRAMLQFAKLLHHQGFHITFVNTEFFHKRLLNFSCPDSVPGLPDFNFEAISDGLPASDPNSPPDYTSIVIAIQKQLLLPPLVDLISKLNDTNTIPPVSCIVADGYMPFTITAAEKFGVPLVSFFIISACGLMGIIQLPALLDRGIIPIKDNSDLDTILDWIPGMKGIRLRDTSSFVTWTNFDGLGFKFITGSIESFSKPSAVVIHTFETLEHEVLQGISSMFPNIYAVGPMHLFLDNFPKDDPLRSMGFNFFKEETECIEWLNARESNSVLYVNFGSIASLKPNQLTEFSKGLANSKHHFLWVFRPDLSAGYIETLPPDFIQETKERGMITGWCPQEEVLKHHAVKGFLTHCGWNSILESLCAGVPLICWPFMADQQPNSRYCCKEWGIGVELDGDNVTSEGVENLVRELMEGEKGKAMKDRAMEWKTKAEQEAASSDSSSSKNLTRVLNILQNLK